MKNTRRLTLSLLPFLILAGATVTGYGQDLDKYLWKHRLLLIKTTEISSQKQKEQWDEFQTSAAALMDRKFVFYILKGNEFQEIDFTDRALQVSGEISEKVKTQLLDPTIPFELILIGLDGTVKIKKTDIITKQELFNLIDAMPMRRYELKKRG